MMAIDRSKIYAAYRSSPHKLIAFFVLSAVLLSNEVGAHEYTALIRAKKFAEVERATTAKLQVDPNNADALIAKSALILIDSKESQFDEAQALAEKCIAAHPGRSDCHEALGNVLGTKVVNGGILSAIGSAGKIKDLFLKAVELDPMNFNARTSLLQFYLQAPGIAGGSKAKAQNLAMETSKINSAAGSLLQANIEIKDEKLARAEAIGLAVNAGGLDSLMDMQRNLLSNIGHLYLKEKKYADAERMFKELNQRFPESGAGNYGLGRLMQEQAKYKEAITFFERSGMLDGTASALYRLGQCQQNLQENAKALMNYEKALMSRPALNKKLRADVEEQIKLLKGA